MSADTVHPALKQPENQNATIWRYMDFAKYVALLRSKALYFPRLDKLDDPFEGSISREEYEGIIETARVGEEEGKLPMEWRGRYFDVLMQASRNARRSCYINCWHINENESEAMWRLYSQSTFAIAIKSTYSKLRDVLPTPDEFGQPYVGPFLGKVTYLDHFVDKLPTGNLLSPIMNKRPSFQHEQECRAMIWRPEPDNYVLQRDSESIFKSYSVGLSIEIDLPKLIELTVVSPLAPSWFLESVADVTERYGFQWQTSASQLAAKPYI